ncbi:hypothetical protein MPC1_15360001 [Methylocella tundrae]|nr:hypothetical protein MPC1_15360001 [Methylocella tundrae]
MALAAVLVPWLLYPRMGGHIADALTPYALWEGLWPVLIGAALALLLQRWGDRLPRPPAGDIIGIGEDAFRKSFVIGAALERADGEIRQWPAAAVSLLVLAIVFGAAMMIRL